MLSSNNNTSKRNYNDSGINIKTIQNSTVIKLMPIMTRDQIITVMITLKLMIEMMIAMKTIIKIIITKLSLLLIFFYCHHSYHSNIEMKIIFKIIAVIPRSMIIRIFTVATLEVKPNVTKI